MHTCVPVYASAHTDVNVTARQRNPMPHAAPALTCLMVIFGRWSPFSTTQDAIPSPFLPRVFPFCPTFTAPSAPESFCFPAHICVYMPASASAYPPPPAPTTTTHTHMYAQRLHACPRFPSPARAHSFRLRLQVQAQTANAARPLICLAWYQILKSPRYSDFPIVDILGH